LDVFLKGVLQTITLNKEQEKTKIPFRIKRMEFLFKKLKWIEVIAEKQNIVETILIEFELLNKVSDFMSNMEKVQAYSIGWQLLDFEQKDYALANLEEMPDEFLGGIYRAFIDSTQVMFFYYKKWKKNFKSFFNQ
jgi:hypothetical protein